jgi:hypothetical protein
MPDPNTKFRIVSLTHNVRDLKGKSVREVQQRVSPLEAGGWLEPVARGPDNRAWTVSPAVAKQFEARCCEEEARKAVLARLLRLRRKGQP